MKNIIYITLLGIFLSIFALKFIPANPTIIVRNVKETRVVERTITPFDEIMKYVINKFSPFGKDATLWALNCFDSESGYNEKAINFNKDGSIDRGVGQVNSVHNFDADKLMEYKYNVDKTLEIYKSSGKWAWYGSACQ